MADDEKFAAMNKACSDIVLNLSKETAARILASEKKCLKFQLELKMVRDEGVRMLVRLKEMMDAQISEAEAASLIQRKKIEELEAQLQEAEDIVRDLREELEYVQAKLERVKSESFHRRNELGNVFSTEVPMENKLSSYQSSGDLPPNESSVGFDVMVPGLSQKSECLNCYNETVRFGGVVIGNQDLPSIMVVDKDPGLYRNGFTQRIRACERKPLNRDSCLTEEAVIVTEKKNCEQQKEANQNPEEPALVDKIQTELEKKLLADINLGTSKSFLQRRKRASRQKKTTLLLGGKQSHSSADLNQIPKHSVISGPLSVNDKTHSTESPSKVDPQLSKYKAEPKSQLLPAKASENGRNIVEIDCANEGENKKMVPLRGITDLSERSLSLKDAEKVDVPPSGSKSKISNPTKVLTSQPVSFLKEKEIKYTYQRKRKRQALSQSEVNASHETGKKTGDGKNGDQKLEQPNSSLLRESLGDQKQCGSEATGSKKRGDEKNGVQKVKQPNSGWLEGSLREHKRMVQVARQLLSLSNETLWR